MICGFGEARSLVERLDLWVLIINTDLIGNLYQSSQNWLPEGLAFLA